MASLTTELQQVLGSVDGQVKSLEDANSKLQSQVKHWQKATELAQGQAAQLRVMMDIGNGADGTMPQTKPAKMRVQKSSKSSASPARLQPSDGVAFPSKYRKNYL